MKGVTVDEARDRLPSREDFSSLLIATAVTFIAFLSTALPDLVFNGPSFQTESEVPLQAQVAAHAAEIFSVAGELAMFTAPLAVLLLVNYQTLRARFAAGIVGGSFISGIFGVFDELEWAIQDAYKSPEITPDAAYFLSEAWSGFTDGGIAAILVGGLFVSVPVLLSVRVFEIWADVSILNRSPLDATEVSHAD